MSDPAGWEDDETAEDIAAYAARMPGLDPSRLSDDPDEGRLIAGAICRAYLGIVDSLFDEVSILNDALGLELSESWRDDVEDRLFMDLDHEVLHTSLPEDVAGEVQDQLGMVHLAFEDWFESFANYEVNPYSADRPRNP